MLSDDDLRGSDLQQKTLSLTYDDGPGPKTWELGRFLYEEGISAAFFVIGQVAAQQHGLLKQLHEWGHVIGNHTWSHPGLVDLAQAGGDVVSEVSWTDAVIRLYANSPRYLRPPYGSWRTRGQPEEPENARSIVARRLLESNLFDDYVGPVMWDIVGEDWEYWRLEKSVEECCRRHLEEIDRIGRGIVLLHDSSENLRLRMANRTMELTKLLVPILKRNNYRFVPLNKVIHEKTTIPQDENQKENYDESELLVW
jgi:peptidoglycan/xylan/chitin deacetylase (PgdA/CDA1 family)